MCCLYINWHNICKTKFSWSVTELKLQVLDHLIQFILSLLQLQNFYLVLGLKCLYIVLCIIYFKWVLLSLIHGWHGILFFNWGSCSVLTPHGAWISTGQYDGGEGTWGWKIFVGLIWPGFRLYVLYINKLKQ